MAHTKHEFEKTEQRKKPGTPGHKSSKKEEHLKHRNINRCLSVWQDKRYRKADNKRLKVDCPNTIG